MLLARPSLSSLPIPTHAALPTRQRSLSDAYLLKSPISVYHCLAQHLCHPPLSIRGNGVPCPLVLTIHGLHAAGVTIVCGTNQGIYARVRRHPTMLLLTTTTDKGEVVGPYSINMDPAALLRVATEGGFWSYAAGVAYKISVDYRVGGLEIHNYRTDLPIRKGLSSSAAFCVLVARAFNRMYDMKMTLRGEMEYAYQGETVAPPSGQRFPWGLSSSISPHDGFSLASHCSVRTSQGSWPPPRDAAGWIRAAPTGAVRL